MENKRESEPDRQAAAGRRIKAVIRKILAAHRALPVALRVWVMVPATLFLVIAGGLLFTLPPGPLCDEGMVLFMEGGCDWGGSNIFFFSKLGLLLAMNIGFMIAWQKNVRHALGFTPHFVVLFVLTLANLSDGRCDTYYSHPNGSTGQMTLEAAAFAWLGAALLAALPRTVPRLVAALVAWNGSYVAVFYLGLIFTNHWTWTHTFWIAAVLGIAATAIRKAGVADRSDSLRVRG